MTYPKDPPDRFSKWQWFLHYTGISRIVYDPVWENWEIRPNGYHPGMWIILVICVPFLPLFTASTVAENTSGLWDLITLKDEWPWELWQTDEEGVYKYLSYREATSQ